jgi:hypothetical protein
MDVCAVFHVVLSRKKKGEERVGVGGRGKYPGAPPHIKGKKRNKPTAGEKRKAIKKKKLLCVNGVYQGRLLRVGRGGSASPNTLLTKIFFNR